MTPEQFFDAVRKICMENICDIEALHDQTDILMEDLLISLGYGKGVELIRSYERWYS